MSLQLPAPIELYFDFENAHDVAALAQCFASDAVVRDEGRTIAGLAAITEWKLATKAKYQHTIEPLAVSDKEGRTIVTGKVSGNFPGSPVNLDFVFELENGRIIALEIH